MNNCKYQSLAPFYQFLFVWLGLLNCKECGKIVKPKNAKKHWEIHRGN